MLGTKLLLAAELACFVFGAWCIAFHSARHGSFGKDVQLQKRTSYTLYNVGLWSTNDVSIRRH